MTEIPKLCAHPERPCPFSEEAWQDRLSEIEATANRTNELIKWGVGILLTIGMAVGGLVYASLDGRVASLEQSGSPAMRERTSRLEAEMVGLNKSLDEIKASQRELLQKIERLR